MLSEHIDFDLTEEETNVLGILEDAMSGNPDEYIIMLIKYVTGVYFGVDILEVIPKNGNHDVEELSIPTPTVKPKTQKMVKQGSVKTATAVTATSGLRREPTKEDKVAQKQMDFALRASKKSKNFKSIKVALTWYFSSSMGSFEDLVLNEVYERLRSTDRSQRSIDCALVVGHLTVSEYMSQSKYTWTKSIAATLKLPMEVINNGHNITDERNT